MDFIKINTAMNVITTIIIFKNIEIKIEIMLDPYLVKYITEYLKLCKNCNTYDIYHYNKTCCMCKKFFCTQCISHLYRNGNHYETISNYCLECNNYYFQGPIIYN